MEEASVSASVSAPLAVDTRAMVSAVEGDDAGSSVSLNDARIAPSAAVPELARKGSNEWASPRSRGRRGTPPPVPRRASRSDDDGMAVSTATTSVEPLPRPRTPAQVLASRAAAAKVTTTPTAMAPEPPRSDAMAAPTTDASSDDVHLHGDVKVDRPEGNPSRAKEELASAVTQDEVKEEEEEEDAEDARRTSVQLGAVGSEQYYTSDGEDGESYRRDDRVDTSTVDEESMYNDDDDDDDDDGEFNDEDDEAHASPGTSDSYVNVHGEHDDEHEDEDEDDGEDQQQFHGQFGDDSLTPDSTPPPSPARPVQQQQQNPPPLASEWIKYVAESGHEYYFNARTQVSQWTRPTALLSPRSAALEAQGGGEAVEEDEPEENQTQHSDATPTTDMLPQLHVHLVDSQPQPQPHVRSHPVALSSMTSHYLESLFAAAARNDETAQLQAILRYEIDVNAANASGLTPLHVAVQHGNARGAAMLLDYGALVDGPSEDSGLPVAGMYTSARLIETPLVMACRTNHASLVRLLVRYGASIYTRDNDGNTVLHIAIRCWSDEVLSCLLEMDSMAAIINLRNAEDETPLHLAARHGNANAVKALLSCGASADVEDAQGRTPLIVSIMENRVDCAQLLQGVGHTDEYGNTTTTEGGSGPAMYDSSSKEDDPAKQRSDELDGLRTYLSQLVQHTNTDGVLVSTIYQYMDAVQRELAALASMNTESRQREENLLSQIDDLTNHESVTSGELAKEREESDRLRQQLEAKDTELNSLQAAFDSLSSRSTMLESIARSSQDKLRRERAEFARQEEYWNQTIDNSLRENAALLESVQSLQQGWQEYSPAPAETAAVPTAIKPANDDGTGQELYKDSFDTSQPQPSYEAYEAFYPDDPYAQSYEANQATYDSSQNGYSETNIAAEKKASSLTPSAKSEPERPISPERVDAVWNRFFENMSRASEIRDTTAYPPPRNSAISPRQAAAPVSMLPPASAIFDSIRKSSRDRLHQLLLSGISPNIRDLGEKGTPLHLASELGDLEAVMLLCEFGADVEIRDENGNTPLLVACSQGHYECTKFLLQSAANQAAINTNRDTALHLAAWDGSFECVEILLEYGIDVVARNALGLTALTNLKTRSPLRHRFDDLASDHPMARTLVILDEAERFEQSEETEAAEDTKAKAPTAAGRYQTRPPANVPVDPKLQANNTSWGRWILGSVFGSYKTPPPIETTDASEDEDDDDGSKSDFEEAESSPSKLHAANLQGYEDLRPPPEIEAELRRKPLNPSASDPLPPPPPEVLDALEKRKLGTGGASGALLSPTTTTTRFASPASISAPKKVASSTPTGVRSRYVDTFNSP